MEDGAAQEKAELHIKGGCKKAIIATADNVAANVAPERVRIHATGKTDTIAAATGSCSGGFIRTGSDLNQSVTD